MQSLRYALQPAVIDITEDWTGLSFTRLSPPINSLFHGQRALIYAQLKGEVRRLSHCFTRKLFSDSESDNTE